VFVKIRTRSGEVIDTARTREQVESSGMIVRAAFLPLLDALDAACSVPARTPRSDADPDYEEGVCVGHALALQSVRQAAGVVEKQ
jgi:hypothetical protein